MVHTPKCKLMSNTWRQVFDKLTIIKFFIEGARERDVVAECDKNVKSNEYDCTVHIVDGVFDAVVGTIHWIGLRMASVIHHNMTINVSNDNGTYSRTEHSPTRKKPSLLISVC